MTKNDKISVLAKFAEAIGFSVIELEGRPCIPDPIFVNKDILPPGLTFGSVTHAGRRYDAIVVA